MLPNAIGAECPFYSYPPKDEAFLGRGDAQIVVMVEERTLVARRRAA